MPPCRLHPAAPDADQPAPRDGLQPRPAAGSVPVGGDRPVGRLDPEPLRPPGPAIPRLGRRRRAVEGPQPRPAAGRMVSPLRRPIGVGVSGRDHPSCASEVRLPNRSRVPPTPYCIPLPLLNRFFQFFLWFLYGMEFHQAMPTRHITPIVFRPHRRNLRRLPVRWPRPKPEAPRWLS